VKDWKQVLVALCIALVIYTIYKYPNGINEGLLGGLQ